MYHVLGSGVPGCSTGVLASMYCTVLCTVCAVYASIYGGGGLSDSTYVCVVCVRLVSGTCKYQK